MGARFDGWSECFDFDLWMRAFESIGMDPAVYLRPRDLEEQLPWDHIRTPVVKKFLLAERGKAYAAALTPDCRDHACYRCGAPCFAPKAREGRHLSLQLAPGQGVEPASLDFAIPPEVTTAEIESRVRALEEKPIEVLKAEAVAAAPLAVAQPEPRPEAEKQANGNGHGNGNGNGEARAFGRRRRVWPTTTKGQQASRYRVAYVKEGIARFTSHLDLVRIFDRAIRVAKIPIAYTQGFNRHAKIAYGPPLSLGATSRAEYFDLDLAQPCPWEVIAAMNEILPEGIRILEGRPFAKSVDSLMAAIGRADYSVYLTGYLMDRLARGESVHLLRQELERNLASFLASGEWLVAKQSHGQKGKTVNARLAVASIQMASNGECLGIFVSSRLQATGYLRPDLLLKSLLPSFDFDPRLLYVTREAMWVERGGELCTPLEALEESAFWRPVPIDPGNPGSSDPALEVNAPRDHH